jgi:hypothetical protein
MKTTAMFWVVLSLVGLTGCGKRTPAAEVPSRQDAVAGPVRELVFEPDVIVAHEDDSEAASQGRAL